MSRKLLKAQQNNMIHPAITAIPLRLLPSMRHSPTVKIVTEHSQILPIHQLRYEILRKPLDLSFESAAFPEDLFPTTLHFVAHHPAKPSSQEEIVGCVTLLNPESEAWIQLRGMAVASQAQGTGVGRLLVLACHEFATNANKSLWCKARQSAIGFYQRLGWMTTGDPFEIPVIGSHTRMEWSLSMDFNASLTYNSLMPK